MLPPGVEVVGLNDKDDAQKQIGKDSVRSGASFSSFFDSALSVVSDGQVSLSDSIKTSSPEALIQPFRRAASDDVLTARRFSVPVDRPPTIARRLSEPVLPLDYTFDLPEIRRSYNTDIMFGSMAGTPRASNLERFGPYNEVDVEGMLLKYLKVQNDDVDSDSDLTRTDGESETAARRQSVASVGRSREISLKPGGNQLVSPQRPRRRRRRKGNPDPGSYAPPPADKAISLPPRGRIPTADEAELRWSVSSGRRPWRAHSSDEILQTPSRDRRGERDTASETNTATLKPSRTRWGEERRAATASRAKEASISPP